MKILFIEPPYFRLLGEKRIYVPTGLLYLASIIENFNHSVCVYNADSDFLSKKEHVVSYYKKYFKSNNILLKESIKDEIFTEIKSVINDFSPQIIGISVKSESVPVTLELINLIKSIDGDIKIILGGPHFDVDHESNYFNNIDYIIRGEAESKIVPVIESFRNGTLNLSRNDSIILDNLPLLNLKYLPKIHIEKISHQTKQLISTSRGCPFKCSFCYKSIAHDKVRYLSGENIFLIMKHLYDNYNLKKFYIVDDTFGINLKQLLSMVRKIKNSRLPIRWSCMSHASVLTKEKIQIMKEGGCSTVHIGVESGSDRILKFLGKGTTVKQIEHAASLLRDNDINLNAFMMVGLPTETQDDIKLSIKLINNIRPNEIAAQVYQPYPNTLLYEKLIEQGYVIDINWPEFTRMSLHEHCFRGNSKSDVDGRIKFFLKFADDYNNHSD